MFTSSKWLREESPQGLQTSRNTTRIELDLRTQENSIDVEDVTVGGDEGPMGFNIRNCFNRNKRQRTRQGDVGIEENPSALTQQIERSTAASEKPGQKIGLSVGWKGEYVVQLRSFSTNHIDVEILKKESMSTWRLTGFYGAPEEHNQRGTWSLLRNLRNDQRLSWLFIGDFNEIMFSFEKIGMARFKEMLEICDLNDLGFSGRWYT
ncbi:Exo_endo_phos domain-containing protein [Gossypium australe]|uniref:Exo_endo_phos domain-containing protein n=1 Tax=Gossypium australe TaxID=47621 RepID=A0A5B6VCJ7_9ROSI|nr:Exo_endo_phos domain-containing protein [Gossypium australe]